MDTNWVKQKATIPYFPDLLWSKPINQKHAGKILIIGGNKFGFSAPAAAYSVVNQAGVGTARVLLPEAVYKLIGKQLDNAVAAPSNPSGSFSIRGLSEFVDQALWADGVLLAGDLGRNSETAILLEQFLKTYKGQLTITKDAGDYIAQMHDIALHRLGTTLTLSLGQWQKIAKVTNFEIAITSKLDLIRTVHAAEIFTLRYPVNLILKHEDFVLVAVSGRVSTTHLANDKPIWRLDTAARAAVWWLQNPTATFEALTTAMVTL
ncbi:MAG: hypothetical protein NVS1B7_6180 [Candidatus Saccharimonadales bacterium]